MGIAGEDTRLLSSALALYGKYGIKSITMDDLCQELGISKKTLYTQIEDKNDLILKVIEFEKQIQHASYIGMLNSNLNAIDELIQVNKTIHQTHTLHSPTFYFDLRKYHPSIYREWMDSKRKRMYDLIHRNMKKGISEGLYREDLNIEIISKLHMVRVEMLHSSGIIDDSVLSATSFIDEIFTYHIHGICNEKGLSHFKNRKNRTKNNN